MYRILEVKRPLVRHRQAAGNINMNLKETGLEGMEMKFQVPHNEGNFLPV